ncbi:MAG: GFA family protein [Pseudomonas sp.]|nr:GFA family protein [Pseudomonas sp.]
MFLPCLTFARYVFTRSDAAAFASTAGVLREHFRWTCGQERLKKFESSPGKFRYFCSGCGSHLIAERPSQGHVIVRIATLDDDPQASPAEHILTAHDRPWLSAADLPSYPQLKPL